MFYQQFIKLCELNNEKPTSVLKQIGVSVGNLNNWKNGTSVKSDILMQLSEHFNVSIDYLLGRTEEPHMSINVNGKSNNTNVGENAQLHVNENISEYEKKLLEEFNQLSFSEQVKVTSLIAELRKEE